ncbi:MAG: glycosyl hydrolase family 18 protein [Actinomycetota bacterium]
MTHRQPAGTSGRSTRRFGVTTLVAVSVAVAGLVLTMILASRERDDASRDDGRAASTAAAEPKRIGYVPYWDQRQGFDVVRRHLDLFDQVSPVWYSLEPTGEVVLADAEHTTVDRRTVRELQTNGIEVIPTVTNLRNGDWEPALVQRMLHDPAAVRAHVRELVELAVRKGYDGIDIDYEHLEAEDRQPYSDFLAMLGAALRAEGKLLTAAVHPKTSEEGDDERNVAQDFAAIGAAADQVRVMAYDYSWEDSPPGPVAPARWVEDVIEWTVTQIPAEKVVLGVVLLGYDWGDGHGMTVDYQQAQATAKANDVTIRRTDDGSPWFRYRDASGARHEVWFEDAVSVSAKLGLVAKYGLGGAFFWRLGGEHTDVWPLAGAEL